MENRRTNGRNSLRSVKQRGWSILNATKRNLLTGKLREKQHWKWYYPTNVVSLNKHSLFLITLLCHRRKEKLNENVKNVMKFEIQMSEKWFFYLLKIAETMEGREEYFGWQVDKRNLQAWPDHRHQLKRQFKNDHS